MVTDEEVGYRALDIVSTNEEVDRTRWPRFRYVAFWGMGKQPLGIEAVIAAAAGLPLGAVLLLCFLDEGRLKQNGDREGIHEG